MYVVSAFRRTSFEVRLKPDTTCYRELKTSLDFNHEDTKSRKTLPRWAREGKRSPTAATCDRPQRGLRSARIACKHKPSKDSKFVLAGDSC